MSVLGCSIPKLSCTRFPTQVRTVEPRVIVLHFLPDDYLTIANSQYTVGVGATQYATATGYHYVVSEQGYILELIEPTIQVPHFHQYTAPSWTGKPSTGAGSTDPDEIAIHIALSEIALPCNTLSIPQGRELARLLCCLCEAFNATLIPDNLHIILANEIDANRVQYIGSSLPSTMLSSVQTCLNGGVPAPYNGSNNLFQDPNCCVVNANNLATLQTAFDALVPRVTAVEAGLAALQTALTTLTGRVDTIEPIVNLLNTEYDGLVRSNDAISIYLKSIESCLGCLCPSDLDVGTIEYVLNLAQDQQRVDPNVNRWINFPNKISDLRPEAVRVGSLWTVDLPSGNYQMVVTARLSSSDYCNGCKVWIDMVRCGVKTRIAEKTLTAGIQVVSIGSDTDAFGAWAGTLSTSNVCTDMHFEIGTDSETAIPRHKILENASVKIVPTL